MGTKIVIGFYRYSKDRPKWAINLGGILQGLSFFFGFCAIVSLLITFGEPLAIIAVAAFSALTAICQLAGRRLAIGKSEARSRKP